MASVACGHSRLTACARMCAALCRNGSRSCAGLEDLGEIAWGRGIRVCSDTIFGKAMPTGLKLYRIDELLDMLFQLLIDPRFELRIINGKGCDPIWRPLFLWTRSRVHMVVHKNLLWLKLQGAAPIPMGRLL